MPCKPRPHYFRMGAIFSKLCFSCCCGGGNKPNHPSNPSQQQSKSPSTKQQLSRNTSLIIERSHLFRDVEEASGYTRVLERDFEIWGKKVVEVKKFNSNSSSSSSDLNVQGNKSDDKINSFKIDSSNESLELNSNDSDYPKKVFQVRHKESSQLFTLTRIKKCHLNSHTSSLLCREINLVARCLPHHPFLVNLYWTWQDSRYLYRVDDGFDDSESEERDVNTWDELVLRAAQLATAIHYIHSYGLIHGNIHPQSIILLPRSHTLKLTSFKYLRRVEGGRRLSGICGDLAEFRAPECKDREYFEDIDWYSYGKVLEFWHNENRESLTENINTVHIKDLIHRLTDGSDTNRLGYGPAAFKSVQSHAFFSSFNWTPLLNLSSRPDLKNSFTSLSQSIGSLKGRSNSTCDIWKEFLEFNWDEGGEIGQTLESIIKR